MKRKWFILPYVLVFCVINIFAQSKKPEDKFMSEWHLLFNDSIIGTNVSSALVWLESQKLKPKKNIIVGVIDSGTDTTHLYIQKALWHNKKEKHNGKDNDKNGYKGDVLGWNFLGTPDRSFNMRSAGTEEFREFKRLYPKYKNYPTDSTTIANASPEFIYYLKMKAGARIESYFKFTEYLQQQANAYEELTKRAKSAYPGKDSLRVIDIMSINANDSLFNISAQLIAIDLMNGSKDRLWQTLVDKHNAKLNQAQTRIKSIEADKDKRLLMGDDIHDASDRFYGNPDIMCDDYFHGTFVAGIIAAQPNPENKMIGIYPTAKIMTIRAVPEGDEYDKDIASAIRYAVDNGAKIINMSFGKQTSPDADMVEDAIRYAADHDVLLVMASGNNGTDCDKKIYYPQGLDKTGKRIDNLIRVGASDINGNPGSISNYGKNSVDLFAPGMDITSLGENNGYTTSSGTSIAAPVVAGIAAIIRDYFPKLSAGQVKDVLIKSVTPMNGKSVKIPGPNKKGNTTMYDSLCVSGGIVNALNAVKMAQQLSSKKNK